MIYLLSFYIVYIVVFIIYSFLGLYHLWRFGYIGDLTKPAIVVYTIGAIGLIIISFILISFRPWPSGFSF